MRQLLEIFRAGLVAVRADQAVFKFLSENQRSLIFASAKKIYVIGAGKAAGAMAQATEEFLSAYDFEGLVVTKYGHTEKNLLKIKQLEAGHPVPDVNSLRATQKIIKLLRQAGKKDLVLALLSGGASSLLCYPTTNLKNKAEITEKLLKAGANIQELNIVRKHLSRVKGGQLAKIPKCPVIVLVLSDVLGDDLGTIASGPFYPDNSTIEQAKKILEKYKIKIPKLIETPKSVSGVTHYIIGNLKIALQAARKKAEELGFKTKIYSDHLTGEAREAAKIFTKLAKNLAPRSCILAGGETTVTVRGGGLGGRNQEMVLAVSLDLAPDCYFLSAGTDGTDGLTEAAGVWCDSQTKNRAEKLALDPGEFLANNDSYNFFRQLNQSVITGPTKTNVGDLQILIRR